MRDQACVVIVGGTSGLGKEIARHFAGQGYEVVISGRDARRSAAVAGEIGGRTRGVGFDLAQPAGIAAVFADCSPVQHLVLAAIERDENNVRNYDVARAARLATLKLVGYTEVIHVLTSRLGPESSIVLFGGEAKDKPYPGSTMVTTVNAAVSGLVRTLVKELAPIRINAIHPGIVGDSPYWSARPTAVEGARSRTPTGRLARTEDVVNAVVFLLTNPAVNGIDLPLDGGWHFMTW